MIGGNMEMLRHIHWVLLAADRFRQIWNGY